MTRSSQLFIKSSTIEVSMLSAHLVSEKDAETIKYNKNKLECLHNFNF